MKSRQATLATVAAATLLVLGAGGCGGSGDDGGSPSGQGRAAQDDDAASTDDEEATATQGPDDAQKLSPGPVPDADGTLPITITAPVPFTTVVRRAGVVLTGTARVAEGTLTWAILGSDLRPIVRGTMQASCGAPCAGSFRIKVPTAKVPLGSYELHAWAPSNAEAGEGAVRLHDTFVPITIVEEPTEGAPAPDAFPPGGVPQ